MKPNTIDDVMARVEKVESGCWLWRGSLTNDGYGRTYFNRRPYMAHRAVYESMVGPVPEGLTLDHLCRTPACTNPAHMDVVDIRTNILRGTTQVAVNARKALCKRGHELVPNPYGARWRWCPICHRANNKLAYERRMGRA